jgi:hypothetical protein
MFFGWTSSGEGWKLLALFYAHLWTQIICEGGVNGRLSRGIDTYSD